jgi:penicillin-binding protein 2
MISPRKRFTLKNHLAENRMYVHRAAIALFIVIFLTGVIFARVGYLQIIQHEKYTLLSRHNQIRAVPLSPMRGTLYDRNGIILAQNKPGFNLTITPEQAGKLPELFDKLKNIISIDQEDIDNFYLRKKQTRAFNPIPLKHHLTEEEVAKLSLNLHALPGTEIAASLNRHYPYGEAFSHVMGYVGRISESELNKIDTKNYQATHFIGKVGIEKKYESELHGKVGFLNIEVDSKGRMVRVLSQDNPIAGKTLHLTLDGRLQVYAHQLMSTHRGAVVVLNPKSGEILAMVSTPSFDPNLFVHGIPHQIYQELSQSKAKPLYNRVIRGQYPPGSTIKPFYALAGLEQGFITPSYKISDPGFFTLPNQNRQYRDWRPKGHGIVDVRKAIAESCDIYFYELAHKMGIDRQSAWLDQFGYGQLTNLDIVGESAGVNPSKTWKRKARKQAWFPGETISNGIGQGYFVATPIQMATSIATLANRGIRVQPHLVKIPTPAEKTQVVKLTHPENWDIVINGMTDVVKDPRGTAYSSFRNINYTVAGKTGTAQLFKIKQNEKYHESKVAAHLRDHHLFVAFSPIDTPEVALAIVLENETGHNLIARKIIDYYYLLKTGAIPLDQFYPPPPSPKPEPEAPAVVPTETQTEELGPELPPENMPNAEEIKADEPIQTESE